MRWRRMDAAARHLSCAGCGWGRCWEWAATAEVRRRQRDAASAVVLQGPCLPAHTQPAHCALHPTLTASPLAHLPLGPATPQCTEPCGAPRPARSRERWRSKWSTAARARPPPQTRCTRRRSAGASTTPMWSRQGGGSWRGGCRRGAWLTPEGLETLVQRAPASAYLSAMTALLPTAPQTLLHVRGCANTVWILQELCSHGTLREAGAARQGGSATLDLLPTLLPAAAASDAPAPPTRTPALQPRWGCCGGSARWRRRPTCCACCARCARLRPAWRTCTLKAFCTETSPVSRQGGAGVGGSLGCSAGVQLAGAGRCQPPHKPPTTP